MRINGKEKLWTRRMDINLVKYIENHPLIWQPGHHHYSSVIRRNQVYEKFAEKHPPLNAGAAKERWVNIRTTFNNVLRKVKASQILKPEKQYTPKWHLWKDCHFLMEAKKRHSDAPHPSRRQKAEDSFTIKDDSLEIKEESDTDPIQDEHFTEHESALTVSTLKFEEHNTETCEKRSPQLDSLSCTDIVNGIVSAFNDVQNNMYGIPSKYADIGRLVSKELSKMNSYEAALTAKKIMEVLLLYDPNNPDNPLLSGDQSSLGKDEL